MTNLKEIFIKNRLSAGIVLIIFALITVPAIFLANHSANIPDDPMDGINPKKSEVLVTGKDYEIDKKQEEIHRENKRKFEKIKEEEEKNNPDSSSDKYSQNGGQNSNGDKGSDSGGTAGSGSDGTAGDSGNSGGSGNDNTGGNNDSKPQESNLPVITTDLENGKTYDGVFVSFWVRAKDYKGRYISAYSLHVNGNDEKLGSTGDSGSRVTYRLELLDGKNTVSIKATDSYGKSITRNITIYGNTKGEQAKSGKATFSLEAGTIGIQYLLPPTQIDLYQGEQLSYIIDRVIKEHGFTYTNEGSLKNGFYLSDIYKAGITNGFEIPEELLEKLEASGITAKPSKENSLGPNDFRVTSGWMYQVNSTYINSGISTYIPNDGDVIRIRFTLCLGQDIGSDIYGEIWGDW